jgi:hypothetical protein
MPWPLYENYSAIAVGDTLIAHEYSRLSNQQGAYSEVIRRKAAPYRAKFSRVYDVTEEVFTEMRRCSTKEQILTALVAAKIRGDAR